MTIDEAIKEFTDWAKGNRKEQNYWAAERDENDETNPLSYADCEGLARDAETRAEYHEQLAEWLTELKQWRIVYGVCPSYEMCIPECKEGYNAQIKELEAKHWGECRQIAHYDDELKEAKRLLKLAVEDMNDNNICDDINACDVCAKGRYVMCATFKWRYTDEAEKLLNG